MVNGMHQLHTISIQCKSLRIAHESGRIYSFFRLCVRVCVCPFQWRQIGFENLILKGIEYGMNGFYRLIGCAMCNRTMCVVLCGDDAKWAIISELRTHAQHELLPNTICYMTLSEMIYIYIPIYI